MENLELYNAVRDVPENAKKDITAGRLKGKTDINPMWRIMTLTEKFGICGIGWKYTIEKETIIEGANGEKAAFVSINLYIKEGDNWSDAIPGSGGSMFVTKEKAGLYVSDECFKMALTDALSVACKALGIGADVYWNTNSTKYTKTKNDTDNKATENDTDTKTTEKGAKNGKKDNAKELLELIKNTAITGSEVAKVMKERYNKTKANDLTEDEFNELYMYIESSIEEGVPNV